MFIKTVRKLESSETLFFCSVATKRSSLAISCSYVYITITMNSTFKESKCDFVLSGEDAIPYLFTTYKKLFILLVVPTVTAFGLFGNAALLFVVYRDQDMRTITNFYLSNLAVSDALLLSYAAFKYIWAYFTHPIDCSSSPFPKGYLYALSGRVIHVCYFASVFLVVLVTFDRYLDICHPVTHRLLKGKHWTARTLGLLLC